MTEKTPVLNASLFAHIANDAQLTGTFKLQGNHFENTITYLRDYLKLLEQKGKTFPTSYSKLVEQFDYLVKVEQSILPIRNMFSEEKPSEKIAELAQKIRDDILRLNDNETVFIPGGWSGGNGGHAMIYGFKKSKGKYYFTVYNSGAGIGFHAQKSSKEKELYSPVKVWEFDNPDSFELQMFISHLIIPELGDKGPKEYQVTNADQLYKKNITSISYLHAKEIEPFQFLPVYAYTGGQLSGTCAQRCLHQMLKMISESEQQYKEFIFEFIEHAIFEYADSCLNGKLPYNKAVQKQILLGIDNNLKLLNSLTDINLKDKESHLDRLKTLKSTISKPISHEPKKKTKTTQNGPIQIISKTKHPKQAGDPGKNIHELDYIPELQWKNDLKELESYIDRIINIKDANAQYYFIEQLLEYLPHDKTFEPNNEDSLKKFNSLIQKLEGLVIKLENSWQKNTHTPQLKQTALKLIQLRLNTFDRIQTQKKLPKLTPFVQYNLMSPLRPNKLNPFWGSYHPVLDKQYQSFFSESSNLWLYDKYYIADLINTFPDLKEALEEKYDNYVRDNSIDKELDEAVRAKGLRALYMLSLHFQGSIRLDKDYADLTRASEEYFVMEKSLIESCNLLTKTAFESKTTTVLIELSANGFLQVHTPLPELSAKAAEITPSFQNDVNESAPIKALTQNIREANNIQLIPEWRTNVPKIGTTITLTWSSK